MSESNNNFSKGFDEKSIIDNLNAKREAMITETKEEQIRLMDNMRQSIERDVKKWLDELNHCILTRKSSLYMNNFNFPEAMHAQNRIIILKELATRFSRVDIWGKYSYMMEKDPDWYSLHDLLEEEKEILTHGTEKIRIFVNYSG